MVTDARFFHGALPGATDVDTRAAVRALPSQEVDPYRGLAPHLQIASASETDVQSAVWVLSRRLSRQVQLSAATAVPACAGPRFAATRARSSSSSTWSRWSPTRGLAQ